MPGMPGLGPGCTKLHQEVTGMPWCRLLPRDPTPWTTAFTLIAGIISLREDSRRKGSAAANGRAAESAASSKACTGMARVCRNSERPAASRPTLRDRRTAFFHENIFVELTFIILKHLSFYFPYPPPVSGKPGMTGGITGGTAAPVSTLTAQVSVMPPLVTDMVLSPVDA